MAEIPRRAKALRSEVTADAKVRLYLEEVDVPLPGEGEVLVRVEAAPINPSDIGLLFAGAELDKAAAATPSAGTPGGDGPELTLPLPEAAARASAARVGQPMPAGNEGAGTVVAAGPDAESAALVGKVVAVAGGGMYSQYRLARSADCLVAPEGLGARDVASSFVNPMTVLGMVETMRSEGHSALVHTAAASNLGQMLQRVCTEEGIPLVNIVRSAEQAGILAQIGAERVCDSSRDDFMRGLVEAVKETGATLCFDAIGGGTMASRVLSAMESAASAGAGFSRYGSAVHKQVYIYGSLDRRPTELTRSYGMAWGVGGWLLTSFLAKVGPEAVGRMRRRVAAGITTTFASSYSETVTLAGALDPEVAAAYGRQATGRKYLILPNG
ncbi:MAG TPA: zinc-binding dehydrogenase [Acidimicrobiales bacterium]|nr:zinc-binding dehydrogenase [Acidimicrobiales bacterium]